MFTKEHLAIYKFIFSKKTSNGTNVVQITVLKILESFFYFYRTDVFKVLELISKVNLGALLEHVYGIYYTYVFVNTSKIFFKSR